MRDSIGGAWTLGLVATFVLLFTSFLAVAINYTKAFRVKNEVIDIVEREEGFTNRRSENDDGALQLINNFLQKSGYGSMGKCEDGWTGVIDLENNIREIVTGNTRYYYCINKVDKYDNVYPQKAYYQIRLFFNFDIPIFGEIFTYEVNGATTQIMYPADDL